MRAACPAGRCFDRQSIRRSIRPKGGAETLETSLYPPVKRYLEKLGLAVKGEIRGCDVVGLSADGLVVICELKLSFNLELVLQGVDRIAACEEVWLAVRSTARATSRERDPRVRKLCRLLGFGLLAVSARGQVEPIVEPRPWRPRRDLKERSRLVTEHQRRFGDPAAGGSTRAPIMTAYRQSALACAAMLTSGPRPTRDLRPARSRGAENPAAQRLWLVRADRARRLRPHRGRSGGAGALAAGAGRHGPTVLSSPSRSDQQGKIVDLSLSPARNRRHTCIHSDNGRR